MARRSHRSRRSRRSRRAPRRSAGLLLLSGRRLLLLRRAPRANNPGLWDLPGGRLHPAESSWRAARREATEEMGSLPGGAVLGELRVARAGGAKRYDVFVCRIPGRARSRWAPRLDREHDEHRWVRLEWCLVHRDELHPVVRALLDEPAAIRALRRAIGGTPLERGHRGSVQVKEPRARALAA